MRIIRSVSRLGGISLILALSACAAETNGAGSASPAGIFLETGPAMADTGTRTIALNQTAIDAPDGCEIVLNDRQPGGGMIQCLMWEPKGGSGIFVSLDELVEPFPKVRSMKVNPKDFNLTLTESFDDFIRNYSPEEAKVNSVTSTLLPSSKTPRGTKACKAYTIDLIYMIEKESIGLREKGIYCAAPHSDESITVTIGYVATRWRPALGQKPPANFDAWAARTLSTYRIR